MSLAILRLYAFVQGWLAGLRDDERGQGLTEYALIIALIAVVCIVAVLALGNQISTLFGTVKNCLAAANNTSCP